MQRIRLATPATIGPALGIYPTMGFRAQLMSFDFRSSAQKAGLIEQALQPHGFRGHRQA